MGAGGRYLRDREGRPGIEGRASRHEAGRHLGDVENNTLTLKGERKFEGEARKEQFHRVERAYGTFSRSFTLPQTVDATKIAAEYKNGVLTVTLPVRAESRPRTINVEVAA